MKQSEGHYYGVELIQPHTILGVVLGMAVDRFMTIYRAAFILVFLSIGLVSNATANEIGAAKHLGVVSCSQSTCHGSNIRFDGSNILRNEFRIWNENDPHARAYATLLTPQSKRIASNLGLESAETSLSCLGCHADNVSMDHRGEGFNLSEGVSCETCHGGGEHYLQVHTSGDHQASLDKGLYPTEDPVARAQLCVSCHVGNDGDRKITHEIMGAGHPRLSFELNTFSSIQPAHYVVDDDYVERKGNITELQVWAIGQLVAAQQFLTNIKSFPKSGLFPELVHMDCLGCHQEMSKVTWSSNPLTKLPAGALRYNDAYLMTSYQVARAVVPSQAANLLREINQFLDIENTRTGNTRKLELLQLRLSLVHNELVKAPITVDQGLTILASLVDVGLASSHRDYASAEQSAMAINSVLKVLDAESGLSKSRSDVVSGVKTLFISLNDEDNYKPARFIRGLKQVRRVLQP